MRCDGSSGNSISPRASVLSPGSNRAAFSLSFGRARCSRPRSRSSSSGASSEEEEVEEEEESSSQFFLDLALRWPGEGMSSPETGTSDKCWRL